jgi:hypothetical protein
MRAGSGSPVGLIRPHAIDIATIHLSSFCTYTDLQWFRCLQRQCPVCHSNWHERQERKRASCVSKHSASGGWSPLFKMANFPSLILQFAHPFNSLSRAVGVILAILAHLLVDSSRAPPNPGPEHPAPERHPSSSAALDTRPLFGLGPQLMGHGPRGVSSSSSRWQTADAGGGSAAASGVPLPLLGLGSPPPPDIYTSNTATLSPTGHVCAARPPPPPPLAAGGWWLVADGGWRQRVHRAYPHRHKHKHKPEHARLWRCERLERHEGLSGAIHGQTCAGLALSVLCCYPPPSRRPPPPSPPPGSPGRARRPPPSILLLLRAIRDARPQDAQPLLDQRMFFWASYVVGQDIDEVWWPTDLVSGYKRGPECRINSTCPT